MFLWVSPFSSYTRNLLGYKESSVIYNLKKKMFSSNRHLKSKNWSSSTLNSSLQALSHPLLLSPVSLYRHLHTILRFQEAGLKLLTRPTSFSLDEEMCPGMSKFFTGRSSHRVWAWGLNCHPLGYTAATPSTTLF